ncbi:hypothetical protein TNCV_1488111 [Trichonephila clavipes]|nr:hypothetical protein TNCV_1488111 [Trichonephila clavipes]
MLHQGADGTVPESPLWIHTEGHMHFDPFDCLVIKVTDSWTACHELKHGTIEDPPCRGRPMHVKHVEIQTSSHWCGNSCSQIILLMRLRKAAAVRMASCSIHRHLSERQ